MPRTLKLGVNIDHVATVRQARLASQPSPLEAAQLCMAAGADGITAHLREDRRHIQDSDVIALSQAGLRLNMEMALTEEMVRIATTLVRPKSCCLVPEKRQELTTEGGLDAVASLDKLTKKGCLLWCSPRGRAPSLVTWGISHGVRLCLPMSCSCLSCPSPSMVLLMCCLACATGGSTNGIPCGSPSTNPSIPQGKALTM